jgi:hypothetical protein
LLCSILQRQHFAILRVELTGKLAVGSEGAIIVGLGNG